MQSHTPPTSTGLEAYCAYYGSAAPKQLVLPEPVPAANSFLARTIRKALLNHKRRQFQTAYDAAVARQGDSPGIAVSEHGGAR
jgi:hypothetical protein